MEYTVFPWAERPKVWSPGGERGMDIARQTYLPGNIHNGV